MPKKRKEDSPFVTQAQWAEGMEMIKDFFGKILSTIEGLEKNVRNTKNRMSTTEKEGKGLGKRMDGLLYEFREFREEQRETNKRLEKKVEMNTDSISSLSKDLQKANEREFVIYNHEQRITKLEQTQ